MWHIYTSIAVLLGGAYCFPHKITTDKLPCTPVIKHFGEPVTTLEVEWHSTIHLTCDALCVGSSPQPLLRWFYKVKNQSKIVNIERLFRSPKFDTYPSNFHTKNELRIRDFGPDEETRFICSGSITGKMQNAEVKLIGTDCLMKYNFRCKSDKRCIDRGQLCNDNNDCPDGEDELDCGNNIDITTAVSTMRMLESTVEIKQTSEERRMRPKIDLCPEGNQTISIGGSALFQCRVMDGDLPLNVTWSRVGGLQLTERIQVMDNGVIMFKGTTQQEQGSYICTATNDMGTTTATATLIVWGPPTIVIQPSKTINAIIGQRVRMECIAQGDPSPSVYWNVSLVPRHGDIVKETGFSQEGGTAILDITNVGRGNTGYYTCVAQNVGGRTEDRVQLIVEGQHAEVKIAGPGTLSIVDGESVELTCTASAILKPLIRWQRREGPLPPGHSLRGGILSIPRLTVGYGGEYICSTSSPEGSHQASVFIIVTGGPVINGGETRIDTQNVNVGDRVEMECIVAGTPLPTIRWSRDDRPLPASAILGDGILIIPDARLDDAGTYTCTAVNQAGSVQSKLVLYIKGKPCDFQCRDGTCIASTKKCDGIPDCPDYDDETCDKK